MYLDNGTERIQVGGSGSGGVGDTLEVGTIVDLIGDTTPSGFLRCNGSTFDEDVYPELYEKNGNSNVLPLAITNFNTDITTGEETFLGYKTDGKWTYVKRYTQQFSNTSASFQHGLDLSSVSILKIVGTYHNAGNDFPLPSIRNGYADYQTEFYHNNGTIVINVANAPRDGYTVYVDIYYTKNNDTFVPEYKVIKAKNIVPTPETSNVIGANDTPNDTDVYSSNATKQLINSSLNKVLWTNSNPSAGMAADTLINLNSSDYDEIRWIFCYSVSASNINSSLNCLKGNGVNLFSIGYGTNITVRRILDYVSDTQYKARAGYNGSENSNLHCVPLYAIGIKYGDSNG